MTTLVFLRIHVTGDDDSNIAFETTNVACAANTKRSDMTNTREKTELSGTLSRVLIDERVA